MHTSSVELVPGETMLCVTPFYMGASVGETLELVCASQMYGSSINVISMNGNFAHCEKDDSL